MKRKVGVYPHITMRDFFFRALRAKKKPNLVREILGQKISCPETVPAQFLLKFVFEVRRVKVSWSLPPYYYERFFFRSSMSQKNT